MLENLRFVSCCNLLQYAFEDRLKWQNGRYRQATLTSNNGIWRQLTGIYWDVFGEIVHSLAERVEVGRGTPVRLKLKYLRKNWQVSLIREGGVGGGAKFSSGDGAILRERESYWFIIVPVSVGGGDRRRFIFVNASAVRRWGWGV